MGEHRDYLNGPWNRLWSLQQHIIFKWGVYTVFTCMTPVVPLGIRGYVRWLVPIDVPARDEIVAYVENELADFQTEDIVDETGKLGTFPGTSVSVETVVLSRFDGVQPYLEREHVEKLAQDALDRLMRNLAERKG